MLTNEELTEIEGRVNKASPGPWIVELDSRPDVKNEKIYRAAHEMIQGISVFLSIQQRDRDKPNAVVNSTAENSGYFGEGQIIREMSKKYRACLRTGKILGRKSF